MPAASFLLLVGRFFFSVATPRFASFVATHRSFLVLFDILITAVGIHFSLIARRPLRALGHRVVKALLGPAERRAAGVALRVVVSGASSTPRVSALHPPSPVIALAAVFACLLPSS